MKKVLFCLISLLLITGCGKKKLPILKDNLKFEINSEVKIESLIGTKNELEIINKDEIIDTSKLGEKDIVIKYKNNEEEKEQIAKINIVDTTMPTIEYQKKLSTTEGTKLDLLKDVKVLDNSKEEITATIDGDYDFNEIGTYNLKYIAVDSSGNKIEEDFILEVKKKATLTIGKTYIWKDSKGGNEITLNKDESVIASAWATNGGATSYKGSYKIIDNILTISLTKYEDVDGSWGILPPEAQKTLTYTITENDSFKDDKNGNVYKLK